MRRFFIALALAFPLFLTGCQDRAEQLYETARLEEKQFNTEHASQLYREIVEKHPGSPYAAQARERLEALEE